MTNQKPKRGASQYRTIATFLDQWLKLFPTDESPLGKQKMQSQNQKGWFDAFASSLSIRIFQQCGPEASSQKKQWKKICELQEQYEHEQDLEKAGDLLIEISKEVEQLRDSFVRVHNRHYGPTELTKGEKAIVLRYQHPDWSHEQVAKEASLARKEELYRIAGYKQLCDMQKNLAIRKALPTIIRGTKNEKTGEIDTR